MKWPDKFYLLAPLWFVLEQFFWPNLRAGVLTGGSLAGNLAFYGAEAGLGAALYLGWRYSGAAAIAENSVQLLFFLRYLFITPLDIASAMDTDTAGALAAHQAYAAALPGALCSCAQLAVRLKGALGGGAV